MQQYHRGEAASSVTAWRCMLGSTIKLPAGPTQSSCCRKTLRLYLACLADAALAAANGQEPEAGRPHPLDILQAAAAYLASPPPGVGKAWEGTSKLARCGAPNSSLRARSNAAHLLSAALMRVHFCLASTLASVPPLVRFLHMQGPLPAGAGLRPARLLPSGAAARATRGTTVDRAAFCGSWAAICSAGGGRRCGDAAGGWQQRAARGSGAPHPWSCSAGCGSGGTGGSSPWNLLPVERRACLCRARHSGRGAGSGWGPRPVARAAHTRHPGQAPAVAAAAPAGGAAGGQQGGAAAGQGASGGRRRGPASVQACECSLFLSSQPSNHVPALLCCPACRATGRCLVSTACTRTTPTDGTARRRRR